MWFMSWRLLKWHRAELGDLFTRLMCLCFHFLIAMVFEVDWVILCYMFFSWNQLHLCKTMQIIQHEVTDVVNQLVNHPQLITTFPHVSQSPRVSAKRRLQDFPVVPKLPESSQAPKATHGRQTWRTGLKDLISCLHQMFPHSYWYTHRPKLQSHARGPQV